jgi:hypothetical protein
MRFIHLHQITFKKFSQFLFRGCVCEVSDEESPSLYNAGIVLTRLLTDGCVVKRGNSDGGVSNFLPDGTTYSAQCLQLVDILSVQVDKLYDAVK